MNIKDQWKIDGVVAMANDGIKRSHWVPQGRFDLVTGDVQYVLDETRAITIRDVGDGTFWLARGPREETCTADDLAFTLREWIAATLNLTDSAATLLVSGRALRRAEAEEQAARLNLYAEIQRAVDEGVSESAAARLSGVDRMTVRKVMGKL